MIFQKRTVDWWIFTLLPIILIIIISILVFSSTQDLHKVLVLIIQQLLLCAIVLSSTDLGLRSKTGANSNLPIGYPLLIIFISLSALVYIYLMEDQLKTSICAVPISLVLSIAMSFFSIVLYNNNPESTNIGPQVFTKDKEEREQKAMHEFEPDIDEEGEQDA
ncbi:MAG: hypothetical protein KAT05_02195 [Spirochaetes bacterium]|nr:hypothetical protein [Spirochaetota bacterium]